MQIVVLANDTSRQAFMPKQPVEDTEIVWIDVPEQFLQYPDAAAWIDLLFECTPERLSLLGTPDKLVLVNSVVNSLQESSPGFVRFNGWPGLLEGSVVEAAIMEEDRKPMAEAVLSLFGRQVEWLPDEPGFVTPRVVSMIINEAYLAIEEGVSTRAAIDTAMKLGTNYPYGPFEWAEKIGLRNVWKLLEQLSRRQAHYKPSALLTQEAGNR
ncbi:MAG TPA: 3-hydroxyacyl-CoA dehydrogenase family protein [Flavisolibacter sp.]|nr:3-hydroxyacyl-CoA dehydrogenase family protein [Flavisolibacter sp.]